MNKQTGFTLVELMIVIAIIGIAAAIAFPALQSNSNEVARKSDCMTPLTEIAIEMELYRAANQTYPPVGSLGGSGIPYDASKGKYTYNIEAGASGIATSYVLTCTSSPADTKCGVISYDNFGRKGVTSGTVDECWR